jgi:hypothetical protein
MGTWVASCWLDRAPSTKCHSLGVQALVVALGGMPSEDRSCSSKGNQRRLSSLQPEGELTADSDESQVDTVHQQKQHHVSGHKVCNNDLSYRSEYRVTSR